MEVIGEHQRWRRGREGEGGREKSGGERRGEIRAEEKKRFIKILFIFEQNECD